LVGCCCGYEETFAVTGCEAPYYAGAGNGCVDDGNDICELGLEDGVEVRGGALGYKRIAVCEGGEDADSESLLVAYPWSYKVREKMDVLI
jgi:hypothetical protein